MQRSRPAGIPERKRLKTYNKKKIIIGFLVTLTICIGVVHFMIKMRRIYLHSKEIQNQRISTLEELENKKDQLEDQLELYSSPVGQERMLRERYNIAKEGEHEIVLENVQKENAAESKKRNTWWRSVLEFFNYVEDDRL